MVTKNYKAVESAMLISSATGIIKAGLITVWDGSQQRVEDKFNSFSINTYSFYNFCDRHVKKNKSSFTSNKYSSHFTDYGVCFGSGTTPATEDDYCMEGDLFTNYTYSQTYERGIGSITYKYTLTNNGDEPFTIGEVGIVSYCYSGVSGGTLYYSAVLLERTTLESPITIPANGGVGQIEYKIRLDGLE